ncbi:hypothetical protein AAE478_007000 [Parahypoxylon ruwenzoriense]
MRAAQLSKARLRAKASGLGIDAHSANDPVRTNKGTENFAQTGSAPAHKQEFGPASGKHSAPKLSEALTNTDWRNNRRMRDGSDDSFVVPATAGPEKTEFQKAGGRDVKKLTIDTSVANSYGVRQIRGGAPIDPDFIRSAPITKKDFKAADDESDSDSEDVQEAPSPWGNANHHAPSSAVNKGLVRLETFTPTTRKGFEEMLDWRKPNQEPKTTNRDGERAGVYQLMQLMPLSSAYERDLSFPVSSIQSIKNGKRFGPKGWDDIDEDVKRELAKLETPRTAGLPMEHLREEYERGQQALATKSLLDDPAALSVQPEGRHHGTMFSPNSKPGNETGNDPRYTAFLDKINKSSGTNRPRTQSTVDLKATQWNKDRDGRNDGPRSKVSGMLLESPDSGISGLDELNTKGISLNPLASEFCSTQGTAVATIPAACFPGYNNSPRPEKTLVGTPSSTDDHHGKNRTGATAEELRAIYGLMGEMRTELMQMKAQAAMSQQSSNTADPALIQGILHQLSLSQGRNNQPGNSGAYGQAPATSGQAGSGALVPYTGGNPAQHNSAPSGFHQNPQNGYASGPQFTGRPVNGTMPAAAQSHTPYANGAAPAMPPSGYYPPQGYQPQAMPPSSGYRAPQGYQQQAMPTPSGFHGPQGYQPQAMAPHGFYGPQGHRPHTMPPASGFHGPQGYQPHTMPPASGFHAPQAHQPHPMPPATGFHGPQGHRPQAMPLQSGFHGPQGHQSHSVPPTPSQAHGSQALVPYAQANAARPPNAGPPPSHGQGQNRHGQGQNRHGQGWNGNGQGQNRNGQGQNRNRQGQNWNGPRAVPRPQGNFAPGDPQATYEQQGFEEYLEGMRSSNVEYALQCRERQARRVERDQANAGAHQGHWAHA